MMLLYQKRYGGCFYIGAISHLFNIFCIILTGVLDKVKEDIAFDKNAGGIESFEIKGGKERDLL